MSWAERGRSVVVAPAAPVPSGVAGPVFVLLSSDVAVGSVVAGVSWSVALALAPVAPELGPELAEIDRDNDDFRFNEFFRLSCRSINSSTVVCT